MKLLTTFSVFLLSFTAFAFEQKAELDFSSLYGNHNAGTYHVTVNFIPKTTASDATVSEVFHRDDNDLYCTTVATFEVGEMIFTIKDSHDHWTKTISKKILGTLSRHVNEVECDKSLEVFAGNQKLHASLTFSSAITLPVQAPAGYTSLSAWLSPYSGYLSLGTNVVLSNNTLSINPSELLTVKNVVSMNQHNAGLNYYVQAVKDSSILSMGLGTVELK